MSVNRIFLLTVMSTIVLSLLACSPAASPGSSPTQAPATMENVPPLATETQIVSEAPTETAVPVPQTHACANAYMPIVPGATWNYKLTGPLPDTFTHTILSVDDSTFVEQDVFAAGVTRQGTWNCENGNLIALDPPSGASANVNTENNVSVDFETKDLSGVTIPATIHAGDTWSQALTLEGTQTINGTSFPASNQLTSDCKAIGVESVTVEAGTFDAMRVECQTKMNLSLSMGDAPIQNTLNLTGTNWYVEKVGLVKTLTTGLGFDSTTELVSYSIP
ncbi:MAG TPA: hypothetical protein VFY66_01925 [Anaerolineales bacterium]|nr:hypothetical protein [Anaerolineales bacterium]